MPELAEYIFTPLPLKRVTLPNRLIRSASYEGLCDANGYPRPELAELYLKLTHKQPLTIITGFCAISQQGRSMHPHQGAIWDNSYLESWRNIVDAVKEHNPDTRLFMQLAHTGRQTLAGVTGLPVLGATAKRCTYFRQKAKPLTNTVLDAVITQFAEAASRAKTAGFDGVQIHAAHGYLIHQFLSPHTNTRMDQWQEPGRLLREVVMAVRERCGADFPLLLKVSHADDYGLNAATVIKAVKAVETELDAVEVSYGTMEHALNIFRGDCPIDLALKVNPIYGGIPGPLKKLWKRFCFPRMNLAHIPYSPLYNLLGALALKNSLDVPVIPVGGVHTKADMEVCRNYGFEALALCRPFIAEPNLAAKLKHNQWMQSPCIHCNYCAIYCDSANSLRCYHTGAAPP